MTTTNPYAPPEARVDNLTESPDDVALRKQYITHEAGVKSAGTLYYISAFFIVVGMLGFTLVPDSELPADPTMTTGIVIVYLILGISSAVVGRGLRTLKRWARIPTAVLSGIGLLAFPLGTAINGYILYLVFSKNGTVVFSDRYRLAVEKTPEIKYKTSVIVWIAVGVLVALVVLGFAVAFFAS